MSRISPPSYEEMNQLFTQACEDYRNGRLETAVEAYRKLLTWCGDAPILHYNLGLVEYERSEFLKARDSFARAAELEKDDDDIYFNLALSQKKCGDIAAAIATFRKLLENDPQNAETLYNLAGCYKDLRQHREAKETYREVLRLAPHHSSAHNNLAYLHHLDGEVDLAVSHYKIVLEHNPQHQAAAHMIAALTGSVCTSSPDSYIREMFDSYSQHFEESLVTELEYRVPAILRCFHDKTVAPGHQYVNGLDLGCGTGLGGAAFAELVAVFDGLDLSPKMLDLAASKNIYRHLYPGSIAEILAASEDSFDFFLATDVFNYVGDLVTTFRLLRQRARAEAVFCFSTEAAKGDGYRLQQTGRFAHSPAYIAQAARATGWQMAATQAARLRKEQGEWVEGGLWLLRVA